MSHSLLIGADAHTTKVANNITKEKKTFEVLFTPRDKSRPLTKRMQMYARSCRESTRGHGAHCAIENLNFVQKICFDNDVILCIRIRMYDSISDDKH